MTPFTIPLAELDFRVSRAGGPGGQHVNKTSTRVEVRWNVDRSVGLTEPERARVRKHLANRISVHGVLRVVADDTRSLARNREAALERLVHLVDRARRAPKIRKPTRPSRGAREARLAAKRRHRERKRARSRPDLED